MTFFGRFGLGARAALLRKGAQLDVPWKTIQALTMFGKDQEAGQIILEKHEEREIYYARGSKWPQFGQARKRRPLESVVLDTGISERILNDCREFVNNPWWKNEEELRAKYNLSSENFQQLQDKRSAVRGHCLLHDLYSISST